MELLFAKWSCYSQKLTCGGKIFRCLAQSVVLKTVSITIINYCKINNNRRKQTMKQEQGINNNHVREIIVNPKNREMLQRSSCL